MTCDPSADLLLVHCASRSTATIEMVAKLLRRDSCYRSVVLPPPASLWHDLDRACHRLTAEARDVGSTGVLAAGAAAWPVLAHAADDPGAFTRIALCSPRLPPANAVAPAEVRRVLTAVQTPVLITGAAPGWLGEHMRRHLLDRLPHARQATGAVRIMPWLPRQPDVVSREISEFLVGVRN